MNWTIFLLSFIPAMLWIAYFYHQDKYEKEPLKLLVITFILGCLSVIPAIILEMVFQKQIDYHLPFSYIRILIMVLMIGIIEELVKLIAVKIYVYNHPEFNEPMDGIVYCVTAAMGFAFVENIGYMMKFNTQSGLIGAYSIGVIRAIFSMFGHASFAVVMGSYLGRAKFDPENSTMLTFKGLLFSTLVHSLYNYSLFINKEGLGVVVSLLCFILVWRNVNRVHMDSALENSPFKPQDSPDKPRRWGWGCVNLAGALLMVGIIAYSIINFNKPVVFSSPQGYTLQHPSFWTPANSLQDSTILEIYGQPYKGYTPRVSVIFRTKEENKDIYAIKKEILNDCYANLKNFEEISSEETKISDKQGLLIKASWDSTPVQTEETFSFIQEKITQTPTLSYIAIGIKGNRRVIIRCDDSRESFGNNEEIFMQIIKDFKIH